MFFTLAQTTSNIFENVLGVFSRADTLAHPDQVLTHLRQMSIVWSVVFLTAGLVCLLQGYKFYKTVTIVVAALIGLFAGYYLGKGVAAPYIVGGCLSLLLAVCAWPLMKYAVALLGGLAGAFIGANAWTAMAHLTNGSDQSAAQAAAQHHWIGALVGLLLCGMLAFILFKLSIILFTSVSGSTVFVMGVLALLLQVDTFSQVVTRSITAHALILPLLVLVPAVIGLILQETSPDKPGMKKPEPKAAAA